MIASITPVNGLYQARGQYLGKNYIAYGLSHLDAINRLFARIAAATA